MVKTFVVHKVYCTDCDATYVGKTKRHIKTRYSEHNDVTKPTAITEHIMRNNHSILFDRKKMLGHEKKDKKFYVKESLTVMKLKPIMNKNVTSFPLELF